jgi:hypothetical protein
MRRNQKCNKMGLTVKKVRARIFEKGAFPKCPVYSIASNNTYDTEDVAYRRTKALSTGTFLKT